MPTDNINVLPLCDVEKSNLIYFILFYLFIYYAIVNEVQ